MSAHGGLAAFRQTEWDSSATRAFHTSRSESPVNDIAVSQRLRRPGVERPEARWNAALSELADLAKLPLNWDSYRGRPPNRETVAYAAAQLESLRAIDVPAPTVVVASGDGQVLASWSSRYFQIELWFEAPNAETVIIETEHGVPNYSGPDPRLSRTTAALRGTA